MHALIQHCCNKENVHRYQNASKPSTPLLWNFLKHSGEHKWTWHASHPPFWALHRPYQNPTSVLGFPSLVGVGFGIGDCVPNNNAVSTKLCTFYVLIISAKNKISHRPWTRPTCDVKQFVIIVLQTMITYCCLYFNIVAHRLLAYSTAMW
jgi:hypothetical protein